MNNNKHVYELVGANIAYVRRKIYFDDVQSEVLLVRAIDMFYENSKDKEHDIFIAEFCSFLEKMNQSIIADLEEFHETKVTICGLIQFMRENSNECDFLLNILKLVKILEGCKRQRVSAGL